MLPLDTVLRIAGELGGVGLRRSVSEPDDRKRLVDATPELDGRIVGVMDYTGQPPMEGRREVPWQKGSVGRMRTRAL